MTKNQIAKKIHRNQLKINSLREENKQLNRQHLLLSNYVEKEETHWRGKNKETALIGRVYWREFFKDEDYPNNPKKGVWVERNCAVTKNGEWLNGL